MRAARTLILVAVLEQVVGGYPPESPAMRASKGLRTNTHEDSGKDATRADALRLEIDVPREVRAGTPVPITLRARNTGAMPLQLYLQGRTIAFDITIAREGGPIVWRRLEGQMIPAILQVRVLPPGEALELRDQWDQRASSGESVGPGSYTVEGALLTDSPKPLKTPGARLQIRRVEP